MRLLWKLLRRLSEIVCFFDISDFFNICGFDDISDIGVN